MSDELSDTHIGTVVTSYCPAHLGICDGADLDCCCSDLHQVDRHPHPIDALCARHDIDIDGIVRLVDEVFASYNDRRRDELNPLVLHVERLRRLARGES